MRIVAVQYNILRYRREDVFVMMLVEINQWRATIGCFRISHPSLSTSRKSVRPFLILFQMFKLLYFCCRFIAISILVLPVSLITHFVVAHSTVAQLRFLPILARVHYFVRIELYVFVEILNVSHSVFLVLQERSVFSPSMPTITRPALYIICYVYGGLFSEVSCSAATLKFILVQVHYHSVVGIRIVKYRFLMIISYFNVQQSKIVVRFHKMPLKLLP